MDLDRINEYLMLARQRRQLRLAINAALALFAADWHLTQAVVEKMAKQLREILPADEELH